MALCMSDILASVFLYNIEELGSPFFLHTRMSFSIGFFSGVCGYSILIFIGDWLAINFPILHLFFLTWAGTFMSINFLGGVRGMDDGIIRLKSCDGGIKSSSSSFVGAER